MGLFSVLTWDDMGYVDEFTNYYQVTKGKNIRKHAAQQLLIPRVRHSLF